MTPKKLLYFSISYGHRILKSLGQACSAKKRSAGTPHTIFFREIFHISEYYFFNISLFDFFNENIILGIKQNKGIYFNILFVYYLLVLQMK